MGGDHREAVDQLARKEDEGRTAPREGEGRMVLRGAWVRQVGGDQSARSQEGVGRRADAGQREGQREGAVRKALRAGAVRRVAWVRRLDHVRKRGKQERRRRRNEKG